MIRRVQNRGYTTMSRLAEHLERLTAGDESNAVIDAGDSVSLMTIHAAKGLEFPVVFVVNLSKGTGGRRRADSRGVGCGRRPAWLSVSDFQSEADEDAKAKDREETKRLLYVALTRARDRLYLASEVEGRKVASVRRQPGRRAAGGVQGAVRGGERHRRRPRRWSGSAARARRMCFASVPSAAKTRVRTPCLLAPRRRVASSRRRPTTSRRSPIRSRCRASAVTARVDAAAARVARRNQTDASSQSLAGTLVHRLFERFGTPLAGDGDATSIAEELARLIRDEEAAEAGDLERAVRHARDAYLALCAQPALSTALESGEALFEVPFSVRPAASQMILRGTFDCLVSGRDGGVTVLELKTGKPLPEHEQQLADLSHGGARALSRHAG